MNRRHTRKVRMDKAKTIVTDLLQLIEALRVFDEAKDQVITYLCH